MELKLVIVTLSALMLVVHCSELLPFEPVQYLKAQLPKPQPNAFTDIINEASPSQAAEYMSKAKTLLKSHLKNSETSAFLIKGEKVLVQRRTEDLKWDTRFNLPYTNTMSLMSAVLPILLEGFKPDVINNPIGEVLRGDNLLHPLVAGRKELSFLDLLNKLPTKGSSLNIDSPTLLNELRANGELALHFTNAILESARHEAWMDALMAVGAMDVTLEKNGQLKMDINHLLQLSLTVAHDLKSIGAATKKERIPLDADKYLFGWWFNCGKDCLIPQAPKDTMFTLSKEIRLYVSPSLELTLIVCSKKNFESVADILIEDSDIWRVLVNAASPEVNAASPEPEERQEREVNVDQGTQTESSDESNEDVSQVKDSESLEVGYQILAKIIHWIWPILVFLFWVSFSHVWVYWILHVFWLFFTSVTKKGHAPRPKTAAENRN